MPAVGLTDHGSLAGAVDLFKAARKEGVKPLIGCEVYVTDDRHKQQKGQAHLTLLAETNEGYANLIRLSSLGYLEGYYYKPRVDWELLQTHGSGLDRALRLPLRPRLQGARGEPPRRRRGRARPARADLRPRPGLRRAAERAPRHSGAAHARARRARREAQPADGRDGRRPLPPRRGRARPRGAALHPVGRLAQEPEPLEIRDRPLLLQDARGDGARLPRPRRRDAAHARSCRKVQRRDRARPDPPPAASTRRTARTRSSTSSTSSTSA